MTDFTQPILNMKLINWFKSLFSAKRCSECGSTNGDWWDSKCKWWVCGDCDNVQKNKVDCEYCNGEMNGAKCQSCGRYNSL
jgi:hypothetical protein